MARNYVNNRQMYTTLCEYLEKRKIAIAENKTPPKIPNYIGECFMLIANNLSNKTNFINYSYKEEMIADGIENCVIAAANFNPERSNNPFAYFTQIIKNAFLRRIAKEKKQEYVKNKSLQKMYISGEFAVQEGDEFHQIDLKINTDYMNNLIESVESTAQKKKKSEKKVKGVEKFYAEK